MGPAAGYHRFQQIGKLLSPQSLSPDPNDRRARGVRDGQAGVEVCVESDHDPALPERLREDHVVVRLMQPDTSDMDRVVSFVGKEKNRRTRQP